MAGLCKQRYVVDSKLHAPATAASTQTHDTTIIQSLEEKIFPLSNDIHVYPGHGADTDLKTSREEYQIFANKSHPPDLHGDILWLSS